MNLFTTLLSALALALSANVQGADASEFGPSATVNLRIEAQARTVFEGVVTTRGHNVTTNLGGTHACDTTGVSTTTGPAPNVLSALDDAAEAGRYTWDGEFNLDESSFEVLRISNTSATNDQSLHWAYSVGYQEYDNGGCGTPVQNGSTIVFAQTNVSSGLSYLDLSGPETVTAGAPFQVLVRQGAPGNQTMQPVKGALVKNSAVTNSKGYAKLTLYRKGTYSFKAVKKNSVRSNAFTVTVT